MRSTRAAKNGMDTNQVKRTGRKSATLFAKGSLASRGDLGAGAPFGRDVGHGERRAQSVEGISDCLLIEGHHLAGGTAHIHPNGPPAAHRVQPRKVADPGSDPPVWCPH